MPWGRCWGQREHRLRTSEELLTRTTAHRGAAGGGQVWQTPVTEPGDSGTPAGTLNPGRDPVPLLTKEKKEFDAKNSVKQMLGC